MLYAFEPENNTHKDIRRGIVAENFICLGTKLLTVQNYWLSTKRSFTPVVFYEYETPSILVGNQRNGSKQTKNSWSMADEYRTLKSALTVFTAIGYHSAVESYRTAWLRSWLKNVWDFFGHKQTLESMHTNTDTMGLKIMAKILFYIMHEDNSIMAWWINQGFSSSISFNIILPFVIKIACITLRLISKILCNSHTATFSKNFAFSKSSCENIKYLMILS